MEPVSKKATKQEAREAARTESKVAKMNARFVKELDAQTKKRGK